MYARAGQASNLSLTQHAPTTKSTEAGPLRRARRTIGNQAALRANASDGLPVVHNLPRMTVHPIYARPSAEQKSDIPLAGDQPRVINAPPDAGSGAPPSAPPAAKPAPKAPDPCGQPIDMKKVVSGNFLGGLTMDDYYPDLKGQGFYAHPGSGGTFDTGKRVGGNAQLLGVIGKSCTPSQFHLEQTVSFPRDRVNGRVDPDEGTTTDDIAASGRDFSKAPSRQEFAGGTAVPAGFVISMADPPSIDYTFTPHLNIELDRTFVTSLVGPSGKKAVNWSLSTRVVNGAVTSNRMS